MREILTDILQALGLAWWIEITTETPRCTYYFGPFSSFREAAATKGGYVEDLEQEGAQAIKVSIKRCKPQNLTLEHDVPESSSKSTRAPILSSQT